MILVSVRNKKTPINIKHRAIEQILVSHPVKQNILRLMIYCLIMQVKQNLNISSCFHLRYLGKTIRKASFFKHAKMQFENEDDYLKKYSETIHTTINTFSLG